MRPDTAAARRFVTTHARLLERLRLAVLLDGAPTEPVAAALAAYQNPDGGFGHALEPDVRGPHSETTSTLAGLELLDGLGLLDGERAARAFAWVRGVSGADGGVPFVLPASADWPRAPWMQPAAGGSHLTFAFAALAHRAGTDPGRAEGWCWAVLGHPGEVGGYLLKFALMFLDAHPDEERAAAALASLRGHVRDDGTVPVPGGTADEKLTPLTLSPKPGSRSRALFTAAQVADDLRRLAAGQGDDGGWSFDWLAWCPAQELEWRGIVTVNAVEALGAR